MQSSANDLLPQNTLTASSQTLSKTSPTTTSPPGRSNVIWSNASGAVSGGGLIAAYCCAGASSTVTANKPVNSGRHYWELMLSVRPGEQHPDTWTNAGVTTTTDSSALLSLTIHPTPSSNGAAPSTIGVVSWGQQRNYRNGDVFMFALDADQGLLYYGVNGQWQNGTPGEVGGQIFGSRGSNFTPFVTVSASSNKGAPEGDRWIANFGGSIYKYPIPATFGAYATNVTVQPVSSRVSYLENAGGTKDTQRSPINRIFEDEFTVNGQPIPLPPGKWVGLAYFRGQANSTQGDSVVLGKIDKNRLSGLVAVNAYSSTDQKKGFPSFKACDRTDYLHISRQFNEASGAQRCWWINHATQIWEQAIFRAAKTVLDERGTALPAVLVNVGFRRASLSGFSTAFYYHNPEEAGISSQDTPWNMSEWQKTHITTDPKRIEYVRDLRAWGESWAPVFYAIGSK